MRTRTSRNSRVHGLIAVLLRGSGAGWPGGDESTGATLAQADPHARTGRSFACATVLASIVVSAAAGCGGPSDEAGAESASGSTSAVSVETGTPGPGSVDPTTLHPADLPDPYPTVARGWGTLPDGREWGRVSAVAMDVDGRHVWVAERCGGDVCIGSDDPVVLRFEPDGTLVRSFGSDLFMRPHGIHVDSVGNVWVTDVRSPRPEELEEHPGEGAKGHQVVKFSPEGEILMVLGMPGMAGPPPGHLDQPNDVVTAPNGDIFVSEGHSSAGPTARISRFSADGTYLGSWGRHGTGPGEFRTPHALAMDSRGRLFVADRGNSRIQIFDQDGSFLDAWDQFGRPSDVFVSEDDELFTVDYESGDDRNPGFRRGIYIGSARDGTVTAFVPAHPIDDQPLGMAGEGIVMDRERNLYVGEVVLEGMTKYEPR